MSVLWNLHGDTSLVGFQISATAFPTIAISAACQKGVLWQVYRDTVQPIFNKAPLTFPTVVL